MASEKLLRVAMKLAKSLGANESKYLGKRSNISFLGKGPEEGKLFQSDINTESLAALPLNKVLPEIETSMSYASGGKLNDLQINKLIDNMSKMADFYRPVTRDSVANITDMASGTGNLTGKGLESLRGLGLKNLDNVEAAAAESPLMSKISERVSNIKNDTSVSGQNFLDKMAEITSRSAPLEETAIMKTIPKNDIAGKTASSREFLLNALKEGDDVGRTVFRDTISPQDLKYITEGGGGVDGDPIVLVQKYFGPRVAELIPATSSVEDMVVFTKRILETATDAKGLRPTDPGFDKFTLKLQESVKETPDGFPFAEGGRAEYRIGGIAKAILKKINKKKVKDAVDDIFETGDYKYDAELAAEALVENNPKLFGGKLIDDIDEGLRSEIYGLTLAELSTRMALKMQARRAGKIPFTETVTEAVRPQFQLNVEKAVSQLNIPKAEATRIAQLPSNEQKLALQKYLDRDMAQRTELMNYEPRKFDAAHGGLAKILEV